jgi:hypothetical protein
MARRAWTRYPQLLLSLRRQRVSSSITNRVANKLGSLSAYLLVLLTVPLISKDHDDPRRLAPMDSVDSFGSLYGNLRRLNNVLPLLPYRFSICSLPSSQSNVAPILRGNHQLQASGGHTMTAFRPLMPETVSGRPGPEKLPLIASHIGMPSDKLLVLRILRSNHQQQYGSSNVSLPQGSPKTLSCSPKITASHIPRKTPLGNNALRFSRVRTSKARKLARSTSRAVWPTTLF